MKKVIGYVLVSLHALLLVFFVFHERLAFSPWLQSFGRVHPLLLHIPIGILVIAGVLVFFKRSEGTSELLTFLLGFVAVTSAITALMGMVLGAEGGYDTDSLSAHRIAGVVMSFVAWATYAVYASIAQERWQKKMLIASIIVLLVTGHLGSVMTHGDQFVLTPLLRDGDQNAQPISDSTSLFRAAVYPILEDKCMSCHNDRKRKGDLSFSSGLAMMKGGEHGSPWHAGNASGSLLIKRILLPEQHEDHMPPEGKPQLNLAEANLLYQWIQRGADTLLALGSHSPADTLRILAEQLIQARGGSGKPAYTFDHASAEVIDHLNDAYRTVKPISLGEPALSASMYIREQFTADRLKDLRKIREQLVSLNLSGMPVTDDDCNVLSEFTNLEKLNINFSDVTSQGIRTLSRLENLKSLAIAGTSVDDEGLQALRDFPSLREVFVWGTKTSDLAGLNVAMPGIAFNTGAVVDESEVLRLSPPLLLNESFILDVGDSARLTHKLPGTILRFTTDGSEPDTISSPVLSRPLHITTCTELKVVACKPGWYCSSVARFLLFRKGMKPTDISLSTQPDKDYRGEGPFTISDNKKGVADNVRGDISWLGYRENAFDALFAFAEPSPVHEIVISYARNYPAFLFSPSSVDVWGGNDKSSLKLIGEIRVSMKEEQGRARMEALRIPLGGTNYNYYRVVVRPVATLPKWHPANTKDTKDKRGWIFLDEIFFN